MHACRQASRLQAAAAAGRRWRSPTWAREAKPPLLTPPVPEALASELWMRAAASGVMGVCLPPPPPPAFPPPPPVPPPFVPPPPLAADTAVGTL